MLGLPDPKPLPGYVSAASLRASAARRLDPPDRRPLATIAAEIVGVHNPGGGYSGPFDLEAVPMMVRPMNCILDRAYTGVIFVGPAQTTKTQCLVINALAVSGTKDPGDCLVTFETERKARFFSDRDLARMFRHSPEVAGELERDQVLNKEWKNGAIHALGPTTIGELSGRAIPRVFMPDYDRLPEDVSGEGSPFDLGVKRNETFYSRGVTVAESSPGFPILDEKWSSDDPHEAPPARGILSLYMRGTRELWLWRCPQCREAFEPRFRLLQWRESEDREETLASVVMVCPSSGCAIEPILKEELNADGDWCAQGEWRDETGARVGTPRHSAIASFWLKGPAAAFGSWQGLVAKELDAQAEYEATGSEQALKTTRNVDQGEAYLPKAAEVESSLEAKTLVARVETYPRATMLAWMRFATAGVDVQATWFEVLIRGWGVNLESAIVDHFKVYRAAGEDRPVNPGLYDEDWDLLFDAVLTRAYPIAGNAEARMLVARVLCDSQGAPGVTSRAYDFWRRARERGFAERFLLSRGEGNLKLPRWRLTYPDTSGRKDRKAEARGEVPVAQFNSNVLKDELLAQLRLEEPGRRYIHLPDWLLRIGPDGRPKAPHPFYESATAEVRHSNGTWHKERDRNEGVDLLVLSHLAALTLEADRVDWEAPPEYAAAFDRNPLVISAEADESKSWLRREGGGREILSKGIEV